jgi:RNA polymerase sigma-70 factor (ECF subfamily)
MTLRAGDVDSRAAPAEPATVEFESLFQANWVRICTVAYRIVGDRDEAEDIALEAFYRLHRKVCSLRGSAEEQNLPGWLFRVASRLGLNALRARKRRVQYESQAGLRALDSAQQSATERPAIALERSEEQTRVRAALAEMPRRAAQVLILRHSGLSYTEVASAVDVAPGSVGTLLARAEQEFEVRFRALEEGEK